MASSGTSDAFLESRFLTPSYELPWDLLNELQAPPAPSEAQKASLHEGLIDLPPLINRTAMRFRRAGIDGDIVAMEEVFDSVSVDATMGASLSVNRQYTATSGRSKMGTTDNLPFQPGGISGATNVKRLDENTRHLHKDDMGLFDIPNGFTRGLCISNGGVGDPKIVDIESNSPGVEEGADEETEHDLDVDEAESDSDDYFANEFGSVEDDDEINELIPTGSLIKPIRNITSAAAKEKKKEWAHIVDLDHKIENFDELVPNPARVWPFQLDTFQQEAIYHLEQGDSVFVAAHTSAGKTVVAEYAISMAHKNMTKAIYTSPIKALSNQKFRDFKHTFENIDVGVITGDVQINPDANCLIMTTEILRSMLYRGSDVIRDVEFVIFDEVHYVNDVDRGVVWEEVIIMLPEHVKVILLSATVPNTYEFASWVGRTKQKDIYVISTPKRPVPLEVFAFAKDTPYKLISADRKFLEQGFNAHADRLENKKQMPDNQQQQASARGGRGGARGGATRGGTRGGRGGRGGARGGAVSNTKRIITRDGPNSKTWVTLVDYLRKNTLLPAVIFVFSKKRCEEYAETLSGVNFSTGKESSEIHMFIEKAVSRLKKEDRELPQILRMRDMLKRGIAVHHGGLLPIVKEVVEILFAKSLVKVLFATETFAMGLNLPTRTVIFSSIRKHDGTGFRNLLPGEFTQMAGRAGRRGLDKIGTVMVMAYNQPLNKTAFKEVSLGTPTKLSSQFRLTYTMILNLLRIEALRVEEMIKRSFSENSSQAMLPEKQIEVLKLEKKLKTDEASFTIEADDLQTLESIFNKVNDFRANYSQMIFTLLGNPLFNKDMKAGKLIVFRDVHGHSFPAYILKQGFKGGKLICVKACSLLKPNGGKKSKELAKGDDFPFHPAFGEEYIQKWCTRWRASGIESISVGWESIEFISGERAHLQINQIFTDLSIANDLKQGCKSQIKSPSKWKEIDWSRYLGSESMELITKHSHTMMELRELLINRGILDLMAANDNAVKVFQRVQTISKINELKQTLSEENLELLPQYNKRLDVLKELDYINSENMTINLKGRVACENNSGFELIITELIFDNFLGDFTSEEIVALLSCFVFDGKKGDDEGFTPLYTPRLEKGKEKICKIVERQLEIATANGIDMTAEEMSFLEIDRFGLVNTVYEWARGQTFKEIMATANDADESEGTIVRVITFLDEICRQVKNSALIIGDSDLHSKMTDAQEKIKRDIVFCASLYL